MVRNAKIEHAGVRTRQLEAEIQQLQDRLQDVTDALETERQLKAELEQVVDETAEQVRRFERSQAGPRAGLDLDSPPNPDNVYVFDDEDESRVAFDEFFSAPDPHLEKVRGFLLD